MAPDDRLPQAERGKVLLQPVLQRSDVRADAEAVSVQQRRGLQRFIHARGPVDRDEPGFSPQSVA